MTPHTKVPLGIVIGFVLLFAIHLHVMMGMGDLILQSCDGVYGEGSWAASKCLEMKITGMIPPLLGYGTGLFFIFMEKEYLKQIKVWQTGLLFGLFGLITIIPFYGQIKDIDCSFYQGTNCQFLLDFGRITIGILPILMGVVGCISSWLWRNSDEIQKEVTN